MNGNILSLCKGFPWLLPSLLSFLVVIYFPRIWPYVQYLIDFFPTWGYGYEEIFLYPCTSFHIKQITWLPILLFEFCREIRFRKVLETLLMICFLDHNFWFCIWEILVYFVNNRKQKSFPLITWPFQFLLAQLIVIEKIALWSSIMNCINFYLKSSDRRENDQCGTITIGEDYMKAITYN